MGYADRVPNRAVMSEHQPVPRVVPILGSTDYHLAVTLLHGSVVRRRGLDGISGPRFSPWAAPVPFKANQDRRHHFPKQRHRVTNWAAYDIALRQRGSLTVW